MGIGKGGVDREVKLNLVRGSFDALRIILIPNLHQPRHVDYFPLLVKRLSLRHLAIHLDSFLVRLIDLFPYSFSHLEEVDTSRCNI